MKVERLLKQLEESISLYLSLLASADKQERTCVITLKWLRLKDKLEKLQSEMEKLDALEKHMLVLPDGPVSFTEPESPSTATSGRGSGVVGYNEQRAVDIKHHLIIAHEVTNSGSRLLQRLGDQGLQGHRLTPIPCQPRLLEYPVIGQSACA